MESKSWQMLIRRFLRTARQDGFGNALGKAGRYIVRRMRGHGPSAITHVPASQPNTAAHYLSPVWQDLAEHNAFHIHAAPATLQRRRQIALIGDLNLPQCRKYRVEQLARFWQARGVEFTFAHYEDIPRATSILQQATHLFEYRLKCTDVTQMLRYEARRLRLPILYDLDDPLFSVSAYATYGNMNAVDPALKAHFVNEAPKYLDMMNGADALSVSTPGMITHAGLYSPRPIYLRRNFADGQTLDQGAKAMNAEQIEDGRFRVAFASGSQGHEADLEEIIKELSTFVLADPKRCLMVMGHVDPKALPGELNGQIERYRFSDYGQYLAILVQADCAVMPLGNDAFNGCKSAVRVLDAAAVGVPSVVGTVGDLAAVVRDGETGVIAQKPSDWGDALEVLANDRSQTRQMGLTARKDVETRWSGHAEPHIIAPELIRWVEG